MKNFAFGFSLLIALVNAQNNSTTCWSEKEGFPCCPYGVAVSNVDKQGRKWGAFPQGKKNQTWCGIVEEIPDDCWSKKQGFPCCEKGSTVRYIDHNGYWGMYQLTDDLENWCGIVDDIKINFDIPDSCWSKSDGFPCCPKGTPIKDIGDPEHDWGTMVVKEDGHEIRVRCGIVDDEENDDSTSATSKDTKNTNSDDSNATSKKDTKDTSSDDSNATSKDTKNTNSDDSNATSKDTKNTNSDDSNATSKKDTKDTSSDDSNATSKDTKNTSSDDSNATSKDTKNTSSDDSNATSKKDTKDTNSDDVCWSMAKDYKDDGTFIQYQCCPDKTAIDTADIHGLWGTLPNGEICGIKGSLKPWNDREMKKNTSKDWNNFKIEWEEKEKYNFERISVFVGDNESELNFGWYSKTDEIPVIRFGKSKEPEDNPIFEGSSEKLEVYVGGSMVDYVINGTQYYSNKITVDGIERNSVYYYQRQMYGEWESVVTFKTYDPDNFNFIFMGDPQIGGSHGRYTKSNNYEKTLSKDEGNRNDAYNWRITINRSFNFTKTPSLLLTAGDQADEQTSNQADAKLAMADYINQESQYSGYLLPDKLKEIPLANCVGNHEANSENYRFHFNTPNPLLDFSKMGKWTSAGYSEKWFSGYNYFFKYNNVLVVILETNNSVCEDFERTIEDAVKKYPYTDWRMAMFHHDIYGDGLTHSQRDEIIKNVRRCLTEAFTKHKFDLVINGHDHVYTASKFITYKESAPFYSIEGVKKLNKSPKGIFFITANCSSGSKYLDFEPTTPDYVYNHTQTYSPTFGVLDFKNDKDVVRLTITSYDVETYHVTDGPYVIEKTPVEKPITSSTSTTKSTTVTSTRQPTTVTSVTTTKSTKTLATNDPRPTRLPKECWAKNVGDGYPCCPESFIITYHDENGYWGQYENGDWCGIITKEVPEEKCWPKDIGYNCCPYQAKVEYTDTDNNIDFGYIDDEWCVVLQDCWAEDLDYPCCKEGTKTVAHDIYGKWGISEDGGWCGIIEKYEVKGDCWSEYYGYQCCPSGTPITPTKDLLLWGYINGEWCGIVDLDSIDDESPTVSTTEIVSVTSEIPTSTNVKTTTTTTTTHIEPSNCADTWFQCGGIGFIGPKCCKKSTDRCIAENDYYSQCKPNNYGGYNGYSGYGYGF